MSSRPTFVLGLGAQKCGTTWLQKYLNAAPSCDMGRLKEYHIWDGAVVPEFAFYRARGVDLLRARSEPGHFSRREQWLRLKMQRVAGAYERYFAALAQGPIKLTGDISPSYSALRAPQLRDIRARLEQAGFAVKVVFLMRDPVERCWSSVRMTRRIDGLGNKACESERAHLAQSFDSRIFELRTNYHETIAAIETVFDAPDIYYGLFEDMFTEPEIRRVSAFFGISPDVTMANRRVNASPKSDALDADLGAAIRQHYAPVYDFCRARFPQTAQVWQAA